MLRCSEIILINSRSHLVNRTFALCFFIVVVVSSARWIRTIHHLQVMNFTLNCFSTFLDFYLRICIYARSLCRWLVTCQPCELLQQIQRPHFPILNFVVATLAGVLSEQLLETYAHSALCGIYCNGCSLLFFFCIVAFASLEVFILSVMRISSARGLSSLALVYPFALAGSSFKHCNTD